VDDDDTDIDDVSQTSPAGRVAAAAELCADVASRSLGCRLSTSRSAASLSVSASAAVSPPSTQNTPIMHLRSVADPATG